MKSENNFIVRLGLTVIFILVVMNMLASCVSLDKQPSKTDRQTLNRN